MVPFVFTHFWTGIHVGSQTVVFVPADESAETLRGALQDGSNDQKRGHGGRVEGPYLELFARRERRGWMTWGDELPFKAPDGIPRDPETGEIIEAPSVKSVGEQAGTEHVTRLADATSTVAAALAPDPDDGLSLPDFLRRGHPACTIGGGQ
jgi:hypothetical protein